MKMLKQYYKLLTVAAIVLCSCEDYEDERLDFSNSLPQFVQISSGSTINANPGDTVAIEIEVRENLYTDITVDYEITGDITQNGTAIIPDSSLDTSIDIILPLDSGMATMNLTGVDNGLLIGRPNTSASATSRTIVWKE